MALSKALPVKVAAALFRRVRVEEEHSGHSDTRSSGKDKNVCRSGLFAAPIRG